MMAFLTACAPSPSEPAICAGTQEDRKAHAAGLVTDGGKVSRSTGNTLLVKLKAGCAE